MLFTANVNVSAGSLPSTSVITAAVAWVARLGKEEYYAFQPDQFGDYLDDEGKNCFDVDSVKICDDDPKTLELSFVFMGETFFIAPDSDLKLILARYKLRHR